MRGSKVGGGDRGSGHPLKNKRNIGLLSNTGPDPLKKHKATKLGPLSARWWAEFFSFDLILYVPSTIFQLNRDRSSCFEPVLS